MGDGYWSQSGCNKDGNTRPDVWWYGVPGQGCWYMRPNSENQAAYWVGWPFYGAFANGGWECGPAGCPTQNYHVCGKWYGSTIQCADILQRFQYGRYILQRAGYIWYQHGNTGLCTTPSPVVDCR